MDSSQSSVLKKLNYSYLFQGILIALATVLSVFFAKLAIEEILIKNAILSEAEYYIQQQKEIPKFNLPDTKNLTGYLDPQTLPQFIQKDLPLNDGFYEYYNSGKPIVLYKITQNNQPLYLIYFRGQVDKLVLYYGLAPLLVVLILLYLSLWIAYKWSHRTVSPIIKLAQLVNTIDFNKSDSSHVIAETTINSNDEIEALQDSIIDLLERLNAFVERERNFTRDASHELRSPLTVISIATDLLSAEFEDNKEHEKTLHKIKRSVDDMLKIIEVFLMISRENHKALSKDFVNINHLASEEIERSQALIKDKPIQIELKDNHPLQVWGSDMVLSVLIGNILRNAILYTQNGLITIQVNQHTVVIEDEGIGMDADSIETMFQPHVRGNHQNAVGFGVGLNIVKRLSDQFNWPITIESEKGKGTKVIIQFPSQGMKDS